MYELLVLYFLVDFLKEYRCILYNIIKINIHSSCETEDFVETHLCKLCVLLQSSVLLCVLIKDI